MSFASSLAFLINLAAVAIFGYSIYFMNYDSQLRKMSDVMPAPLKSYGLLKFLTYQCLLIQFANALLHVLAAIVTPLKPLRDLVFTGLAYPVGSVVVYSFWAVWHLMGRELIFPVAVSQFYPDWLNHATHTIIAPINLVTLMLVNHKYSFAGSALLMAHQAAYVALLFRIKFKTGHFVYRYLETMNDTQLVVYFGATLLVTILIYQSGKLLTGCCHPQQLNYKDVKQSKSSSKSKTN